MKKLVEFIKTYWKDPVWSKVIAAGIIFIIGSISTGLYAIFKNIYSQVSFKETYKEILLALTENIVIARWILILSILVYIILISKSIFMLIKEIINIIKISENKSEDIEKPRATEPSTVMFTDRMAKAFPGIRDLTWFNDPVEAIQRLEILLREPLDFKHGIEGCETDPIWWFRGTSSLYIKAFKKLSKKTILMNIDRLKIKRIAVSRGDLYYKDFVYVEAEGEKQSGIYSFAKKDIQKHVEIFGYSREEYGEMDYFHFWKRPISRQDFDDRATVINGRAINADDAVLRVRYLSNYNFVIGAKGSPYNSRNFQGKSKEYLNGILKGTVQPEVLFDYMDTLKKHEE